MVTSSGRWITRRRSRQSCVERRATARSRGPRAFKAGSPIAFPTCACSSTAFSISRGGICRRCPIPIASASRATASAAGLLSPLPRSMGESARSWRSLPQAVPIRHQESFGHAHVQMGPRCSHALSGRGRRYPLPLAGMHELHERTAATKRMIVLRKADHAHFFDKFEQRTGQCPAEEAHLFICALTLSHFDASMQADEHARRFLDGDVDTELAARGVNAFSKGHR